MIATFFRRDIFGLPLVGDDELLDDFSARTSQSLSDSRGNHARSGFDIPIQRLLRVGRPAIQYINDNTETSVIFEPFFQDVQSSTNQILHNDLASKDSVTFVGTSCVLARNATIPYEAILKSMEHGRYLNQVSSSEEPLISRETASSAAKAWQIIWEALEYKLSVPAACTGPDGQMLYAWDRNEHHLELEIAPGDPTELFYRNRQTGELWSDDFSVGGPISSEALAKLKLFV